VVKREGEKREREGKEVEVEFSRSFKRLGIEKLFLSRARLC